MNLWKVSGNNIKEINKTKLNYEERLEDWIVNDSSILGIDLLIIGRQVPTQFGGRIDLLCIDPQGDIVILELKRDRTPREIVAQILDYASWVKNLEYKEINTICLKYIDKNLSSVFSDHFEFQLPENINTNHSMIIVAAELDDSSERIIQYLTDEYDININVIFFNFFKYGEEEILGRAWLMDPEVIQVKTEKRKPPWTGYWFVNIGEGPHRNWDDNKRYGYTSAGQGIVYSRPLQHLNTGNKIFAYLKGKGYVGYGEITKEAVMIKDFIDNKDSKPLLELPLKQPNAKENSDNPELSEWVVGVKWYKTYQREEAKYFKGIFAKQHIVCKLRHEATLEFLMKEFGIDND